MLDLSLNLGINLKEIKKTCVICPVSDHSLFSKLGKSKKNNLFFAKIMKKRETAKRLLKVFSNFAPKQAESV